MILAFDFGGTKNTCAAFERDAAGAYQLAALERRASPPDADGAYDYATMCELARGLLRGRAPDAIGVSFGGPVRASAGWVVLSHHVPGWENTPLRDQLASLFETRVVVDNDANVAALGEARFGAGQGCASLFYVTVSTGVGGGWILNGEIYRGANELAGEIGHIVIAPDGPPCVCGRRGCVEQLACGPAIARMARERLLREPARGEILRAWVGENTAALTAQQVNDAAQQGDALAQQVMADAARALGFALGNVIVLMNPQRVVLGGGVTKAGADYFENVRAAARANVMPELHNAVDIQPAALGDDAPLWGALALVS
ncbi:MAG: ROK family protein [Chloroflexi bacterium]|nr:ROK family protein [Chloroflexota bacterium]